jgi:hypothetical protein
VQKPAPATSGRVFQSTNAGGNWTAVNTGLTSTNVYAIAVDRHFPATLYAGTGGGAFQSTNAGGNWTAVNTGLTVVNVYSLALDSWSPASVYAGTSGGGVFKLARVHYTAYLPMVLREFLAPAP